MVRYITTLERLGKDVTWLILQQARGIPEAKVIDDFMVDRTIVQMFAKADLSERLCITAAVRQMSGHCVYFAPEDKWKAPSNVSLCSFLALSAIIWTVCLSMACRSEAGCRKMR